ncbi:MAG: hypothetical protein FWE28_04650 [Oscillospiraceae bacterium]|nr:hypothetical protein [Oscillospiraceae bacterium]
MKRKILLILRIAHGIVAATAFIFCALGLILRDMQLTYIGSLLVGLAGIIILIRLRFTRPQKQHKPILKAFLASKTLETYDSHIWDWEMVHETLRKQCQRILNHHPVKGITGDIISAENKREIARYIDKFKAQEEQELTNYYHLALSVDAIIQEYRIPQSKEATL